MACTERYATADDYAAFWCSGAILTGYDDSGGAANPSLSDSTAEFLNWEIEAGVGMIVYNQTSGLSGPITAVSQTSLTATGVTWDDGDQWWMVPMTGNERATVEHFLDMTAYDIHAALASVGACDCTLASWAEGLLQKLNVIEAGAFHRCPCARPPLSEGDRQNILAWADRQLELIRTSKLELCHSETGADYPSIGWASRSWTERSAAEIIANDIRSDTG